MASIPLQTLVLGASGLLAQAAPSESPFQPTPLWIVLLAMALFILIVGGAVGLLILKGLVILQRPLHRPEAYAIRMDLESGNCGVSLGARPATGVREAKRCPQCGAELAANAPEGLC